VPPPPPENNGAAASRVSNGVPASQPELTPASRKMDGGAAEWSIGHTLEIKTQRKWCGQHRIGPLALLIMSVVFGRSKA